MIYILLPVYNEADNLEALFKNVRSGMESRGYPYKIIACNDGSSDDSYSILVASKGRYPLHVIGKSQNEGLGFALRSLLSEVVSQSTDDKDIAVVFDSDNTHNPEHIYHMVNKIRDGFDVAIASRYLRDSRIVGVSRSRRFLSLGASVIMRIVFPIRGVKDYTCGYRAYSMGSLKKAVKKFGDRLIEERGFACMAELLIKLRTLDLLAVEVPLVLRYDLKGGNSKMNVVNTVGSTLAMLVKLRRIK
ncbi:MAG: glycosyltransferase family 2 protein [Nitrospirae bacterium]|nr:glycosyltransferase family 2 protein [Nitrospirota bacterium]